MKTTFKMFLFLCLVACVLLYTVACNAKDEELETTTLEVTTTPEETTTEEPTKEDLYPEPIKQLLAENKPYSLEFVSNGDGTCSVRKLYLNNQYETEFDIIIPEKSPAGDVVVEIDLGDSITSPYDVIPQYLTTKQLEKMRIQVEVANPDSNWIGAWWVNAYTLYQNEGISLELREEYIRKSPIFAYMDFFEFNARYSHTNDTFKRLKMTDITPDVTRQYYEEFIQEAREAGAPEEVLAPYKELLKALPTYANYSEYVRYLHVPESVNSIDVESMAYLMIASNVNGNTPDKGIVLPELDLETTQDIGMYFNQIDYDFTIFSLSTSLEGYEEVNNFAVYSSEKPESRILAWHYVDGVPTRWR